MNKINTIKIDGINYKIISINPFDFEGKTRERITLQRSKGKRYYSVYKYENGMLSRVFPLPYKK